MKRKIALVLALTVLLSFSVYGCGSSDKKSKGGANKSSEAPGKGGKGGKQLVAEIGPNPETIDPALNSTVDGGNMLLFAFDCLLNIDQKNKVTSGAAEKYDISPDGLTWTFHLHKDLKWSDGSDLTAEDFVYSWKRMVDPDTAAPYAKTALGMVKGFDEAENGDPDKLAVSAPDKSTFVVELSHPCVYFDKMAAFAPLSPVNKKTIEENGDAWATKPETYICNGPFYISEWVPNSYIMFKKNPYFRDSDKVKLDSIKLLLIEDANSAYAAYQTGETMMIKDVPTAEIKALRDNKEFHIEPSLGTYYVSLNDSLPQFQDPRVRKALSLALDRKYMSETLAEGVYTPAGNFLGTGLTDWDDSSFMDNANGGKPYIDTDDYEGNLKEAKKLMAEAGYPDGKGFPTITYSTNDASWHKVFAQYMQEAWKKLGVTVNVDVVEWASFTPMRRAGDYEASRNGWVMDYNDPSNMLELFYSDNGNNDSKYNNPEFDAMMDKAAMEADAKTRSGYLHQAEDILMEDAGAIPIAYYNDFYLQSSKIKGAWHSPYGYWYFQYADIED